MLITPFELVIKKLSELEKSTIIPNFDYSSNNCDYHDMFTISKKCLKNVNEFLYEYKDSIDIIKHKYNQLVNETEKICILIGIKELKDFLKKGIDDEKNLNEIITKYPFLCLKIIGPEWKNEYYDLYLHLLNSNKYKKCVILLKNKGLDDNILNNKNSNAFINILEDTYNIYNTILNNSYYSKMNSIVLNINNNSIDDYVDSLIIKENYNFNISFINQELEDNIKSTFWINLSNDIMKVVRVLFNIRKIKDATFYDDLYNCCQILHGYKYINNVSSVINNIELHLESKYNKYINESSYEIFIKNGVKKICNVLFNKNLNKNKLYDLKEEYPELFRDYIIRTPISLQRNNYVEFWSIGCFLNKKYCSEYLKKNSNYYDINFPIDNNFENKMRDYYMHKNLLVDDINSILNNDNSKDRMHLEFRNMLYNFQYDIDNEKLQKLIDVIKLYY